MFSGSQFDATSAFSGGGFMTSQSTQLNDSTLSPAKNRETQGLFPVTVKQISEASQSGDEKSNFIINGVDVTNVTMVGMVFDKAGRTTDVGFILDDGTGRIGCRRWVNETVDTKEMDEILDGMYVRVYGHLKSFQGVRELVAFSVRPVTNYDEISFHFIDCIHNHLHSKFRSKGAGLTQTPSDSSLNAPIRNASNGYQPPSSNTLYGHYSMDGLKDCDKLVLDYLHQHSDMADERGIHVNELSRELKLPEEKIRLSLKTLGDDGLVYSTIDDNHYKQA
ncbi:replication protein A 32 kDa subunit A [Quillaja saponaria]|uniref:Replication protein A 32 kDa subunit A n=1 Tax=Quillaja saponaria TaxID=32244 RepID=A0AAD7LXB7_QUISA|nr:replication protein A 32 kDa subunit A [Quillaja saponaria]KAJ7966065.1 replication protein A 32 kDa subunit A [Quillaja saponaria]